MNDKSKRHFGYQPKKVNGGYQPNKMQATPPTPKTGPNVKPKKGK